MTVTEEINEELAKVFDDKFINLWWYLKLPGLGNVSPREYLETNPDGLLDYVKAYATPAMDVDAGGTKE